MSRLQTISRLLISIATLGYGLGPPLPDLTESHVFHPAWPPHARFHMVWLLGTCSTLALLALHLMWVSKLPTMVRLRLAGLMGLCVYGGFFISTFTQNLYGGALVDPSSGVPQIMGMVPNLLMMLPMVTMVVIGLWLNEREADDPALP